MTTSQFIFNDEIKSFDLLKLINYSKVYIANVYTYEGVYSILNESLNCIFYIQSQISNKYKKDCLSYIVLKEQEHLRIDFIG